MAKRARALSEACAGALKHGVCVRRVCVRVQQGYECTRRYLEELVTSRTQRLSRSSRHTCVLGAAARQPSLTTAQTISAPALSHHLDHHHRSADMSAVLANEQMLVADLLPTA